MMRTVSFRSKCKISSSRNSRWITGVIDTLRLESSASPAELSSQTDAKLKTAGASLADVSRRMCPTPGPNPCSMRSMQGLSAPRLSWECNQNCGCCGVRSQMLVRRRACEKKNTTYCRRPWYSQRWWSSSASDPRTISIMSTRVQNVVGGQASTAPYIMSMFQSK